MVEQKNPLLALRTFRLALDQKLVPLDSKLLFIGTGPLLENVEAELSLLQLSQNVRVLRYLTQHEVMYEMARSHTLLMTSVHEGSPLVRLEALASGMTIVSTDSSGLNDIMSRESHEFSDYGVFITGAKELDIALKMQLAIDNSLWTETEVQRRVGLVKEFAPQNVAKQYLKVFDDIASNNIYRS